MRTLGVMIGLAALVVQPATAGTMHPEVASVLSLIHI